MRVGARPEELRRLSAVLRRAGDEVAWLRPRLDAAQQHARAGRADTRWLLRLEEWLEREAADLRRRADRLEESFTRRDPLSDVHPPGVAGGRCGAVAVPVGGRRSDGRGGDEALGEPLFAAAPLQCRPGWAAEEFVPVAVVGGSVLYARRPKRTGDAGGGGGGAGKSARRRQAREAVLVGLCRKLRLPHGDDAGPFRYEPRPQWRPGDRLPWDAERRGFVDAQGNAWRRGPSRTPGDPFEWDVQLSKDSPWKSYSKDGKHLNVDLRGRISH